MVRVGDELTGQIVKSEIVTGKYGDFASSVEPVKATASIRPTGWSSCAAPATPSRSGTSARSRKPTTWCRFNSPAHRHRRGPPMKSYEIALRRANDRPSPDDDDFSADDDFRF
jgi:hypothetical protein